MEESIEPLLDNNENVNTKIQRKKKGKSSETLKAKKLSFDLLSFNEKNSKTKKIENRFIFKVYLHVFCQFIIILLMIILAFKNKLVNSIISNNIYAFFSISIATFIAIFLPLFIEKLLKIIPYNYIYFLIFTIGVSYIICKIAILFSPLLVRTFSILFFFELIYLTIDAYINKKYDVDIGNASKFIGLLLIFIGFILYFIERIKFINLIIIITIILLIGIFLIYDLNLIFLEKRRKFEENDYVLATLFLYIDIFQTIFELIENFYNSCEPERVPIQKQKEVKSMIYTGEEAYEDLYNKEDEEDKDNNNFPIKRTNSAKGLNMDSKQIIIECEDENDIDEKEDDNELGFQNKYNNEN